MNTTLLKEIVAGSKKYNACGITDSITDSYDAVSAILSPQGREFVMNTNYPPIKELRATTELWKDDDRVWIDAGCCETNLADVVAIGETNLLVYANKSGRLYHIMALHGAKVVIKASNYAVITATEINSTIDIENDGTATILIEKKN